jgi:hypothetical protein
MKGGEEFDAFSNWRNVMNFREGQRAKAKAQYWRRARRDALKKIRDEIDQFLAERGK